MKWYENHRHNWSYCHDLRFWISFYFLCGWEAVEYGDIPPSCVYAICHILARRNPILILFYGALNQVTLLNCEYHNCEYCFCDLTFANVAIVKYIPLKIANLAIVKYISINIANFLILYNLQLITQQMSSFMSFVINCVIYFAVYLWYLEHFVFIHCSDVRWTINEELVNNTIPNTIFFMPK